MSEENQGLLIGDYVRELSQYPREILAGVCKAYITDPESRFFPKMAALSAPCAGKVAMLRNRRRAIGKALEEAARAKAKRLTPEEMAAMTASMKEVEIPGPTKEEKIAATVEHMRESGATLEEIEAFRASMEEVKKDDKSS